MNRMTPSDSLFRSLNPATGEVIAQIPNSTADDVDRAPVVRENPLERDLRGRSGNSRGLAGTKREALSEIDRRNLRRNRRRVRAPERRGEERNRNRSRSQAAPRRRARRALP